MHAVRHLVILNVLLVLGLQLIVGDFQALTNLVHIHDGIAHHPLFRDLILCLVLFVGGSNLRVI